MQERKLENMPDTYARVDATEIARKDAIKEFQIECQGHAKKNIK